MFGVGGYGRFWRCRWAFQGHESCLPLFMNPAGLCTEGPRSSCDFRGPLEIRLCFLQRPSGFLEAEGRGHGRL